MLEKFANRRPTEHRTFGSVLNTGYFDCDVRTE
jgi:hypothetical protein